MKTIRLLPILMVASFACAADVREGPAPEEKPKQGTGQFGVVPIGHIVKQTNRTVIQLDLRYQKGLLGLDQWSHIWVLYWFDKNDTPEKRSVLQVHPRGNRDNPLTGVFATRSPMRPNLIALSLCRVVSIKGNEIEIEGSDAFDKTPVIDIKPYSKGIDTPTGEHRSPRWTGNPPQ